MKREIRLNAILSDALQSLFRPPATERYPFEKNPAPAALRGKLTWDPEKCTGCNLCIKDCPSNAIQLFTIDKANKRFVMRYHEDRCTYCAQCVQNCRFAAMQMSSEQWELAATGKQPFTVTYGKDIDLQALLAKSAAGHAEPAAEG